MSTPSKPPPLTPEQRRQLIELLARAIVADLRADAERRQKTA